MQQHRAKHRIQIIPSAENFGRPRRLLLPQIPMNSFDMAEYWCIGKANVFWVFRRTLTQAVCLDCSLLNGAIVNLYGVYRCSRERPWSLAYPNECPMWPRKRPCCSRHIQPSLAWPHCFLWGSIYNEDQPQPLGRLTKVERNLRQLWIMTIRRDWLGNYRITHAGDYVSAVDAAVYGAPKVYVRCT